MGSSAVQKRDEGRSGQKEQLGGARADFVANLGRRRLEISSALDLVRGEPSAARPRDDLRRRVHALAAGARLLRFESLAAELQRVTDALEAATRRGSIEPAEIEVVANVIGRMTSLAWGQSGTKATLPSGSTDSATALRAEGPETDRKVSIVGALVVGKGSLGEALSLPSEIEGLPSGDEHVFEVEQTDDVSVAVDFAKALAPDVIVIDGDLAGAADLVENLAAEQLTEAIPVLVVGKFYKAEDASRFVAMGVARTLPKPVSPGEIRRACATIVSSYVKREVVREPIGQVNVDQLGARLAEELRRGLSFVDHKLRDQRVDLGEGTEVLAALWGAVARIRDVVTIKSKGGVRFMSGGPEGAMPLAPWLGGNSGPDEGARGGRSARAASDVSLQKARVVVADDDPAVTWFLAGVLKAAGATVYEARDGERAFEVAKHCEPDLVISDILMPKLDGFALTRALKRDIVLRDVPVVLLSWKEDLLQRVRELGADADGYMRKEASAGAVVQRVRELLRQRKRVAERIAGPGEVRGRLDGMTTSTLLRLVCNARPNATVTVRDASYLYEIEVRDGRPVRATRTSVGGSFERGSSVIAALLGAGDGRFVVAPTREDEEVGKVRTELSGTYADQLAPVIATARAAHRLLVGANLVRVQRVVVDEERIDAYLAATPEPARKILRSVADGASPRVMITSGEVAPRLLEDVLGDAAAHGAIIEVLDLQGVDRLPEATAHEIALLRGDRAPSPILRIPVPAMPSITPMPAAALEVSMPTSGDVLKLALAPTVMSQQAVALPISPELANFPASSVYDPVKLAEAAAAAAAQTTISEEQALPASSKDLDDPWFHDMPADVESPVPPSGQRLATPAPNDVRPNVRTPSPRPVVIREERELTPTPSELPPPPGLKPMLSLGSLHPPPVALEPEVEAPVAKTKKQKTPKPVEAASRKERAERETTPSAPFVDKNAPVLPSAFMPRHTPEKPKDRKALYWVMFALVGVSFAVWARWSRNRAIPSEDLLAPATASAMVEGEPEATAPEASASPPPDDDKKPKSAGSDDIAPEDLPLRDYDKVKKGQGMLEVVAGKSDTIYIDGKPMGSGPVQSVALKAKSDPYEVKVKLRGEQRVRFVTVKEGRLTRIRVAPPWGR